MNAIEGSTHRRFRWGLALVVVSIPVALFMAGAIFESRHPFLPGDFEWVAEDPGITRIDAMIERVEPRLDPAIRKFYAYHLSTYTSMYNIDPALMVAIIHHESRWNPLALSRCGATGLTQIMARYHSEMIERNGNTPDQASYVDVSIRSSCEYLAGLLKRFSDPTLAVAAYNCGPNRKEFLDGRVPAIPETQAYTRNVMMLFARLTLQTVAAR